MNKCILAVLVIIVAGCGDYYGTGHSSGSYRPSYYVEPYRPDYSAMDRLGSQSTYTSPSLFSDTQARWREEDNTRARERQMADMEQRLKRQEAINDERNARSRWYPGKGLNPPMGPLGQ